MASGSSSTSTARYVVSTDVSTTYDARSDSRGSKQSRLSHRSYHHRGSCGRAGVRSWCVRTQAPLLLSAALMGGFLGGFCNALMSLFLHAIRLNVALHSTISPLPYKPGWLYNKMVWGSFWAVLHLLPITRVHWLLRSIVYGLIASTIHLAVVFPAQHHGMFAVDYGTLTFILIYLEDQTWAWTSGAWYAWTSGVLKELRDGPASPSERLEKLISMPDNSNAATGHLVLTS